MKKLVSVLLALMLLVSALVLSSCGGAKGKTLAQVQEAGKLVIATSPDFPPFEELQSDGSVTGIEIDILNLICEKLGVTLDVQQMEFDAVLPGVQAGKYDVGVSGITVDEDRKKNSLFTNPYCLAAQAIVVTEDSAIKTKADLDGKAVSVQTGTTAEKFCMNNGYNVSAFAANNDAESALLGGKVDAWVIDDLTAAAMVAEYNETGDKKLVILDEAMTTEPYAFAFCFGSEDLVAKVNEIIADLLNDGTIAGLFAKYDAPYTAPTAK